MKREIESLQFKSANGIILVQTLVAFVITEYLENNICAPIMEFNINFPKSYNK